MVAAGFVFVCLFLMLAPLSTCASIPTEKPPLTVLMDFEAPHSDESLRSLRRNLNQLLTPGGIAVDVELRDELPPNPQFGQLVIFKMRGSCSMNPLKKVTRALRSGPLAMAYVSDGQVLHFGEVECDRVRNALQRILGTDGSHDNQENYGAALAVVIAHELYHMLGNATGHTRDGLTKPALSAEEMVSRKLGLSPRALHAIRDGQ
jgi:hypothetical protein